IAARVRAGGETARIAVNDVFGTLDLDPTPASRPDDDLVTCGQAGILENTYGERDLMLSGNFAHCFTILTARKATLRRQRAFRMAAPSTHLREDSWNPALVKRPLSRRPRPPPRRCARPAREGGKRREVGMD